MRGQQLLLDAGYGERDALDDAEADQQEDDAEQREAQRLPEIVREALSFRFGRGARRGAGVRSASRFMQSVVLSDPFTTS